jgi:hypothetical protein
MTRVHLFADESGNFDFSRGRGASRYFILTTVSFFDDRASCRDLEALRYDLAWRGVDHPGPFHATEDAQAVRDEVFAALAPHRFRVDAVVLEKSKAQPHLRTDDATFYRYAWWLLMRYVAPQIVDAGDELLVVAASIGTKKRRSVYHNAVQRVMRQVLPGVPMRTAAWRDDADTGLQIADYRAWALKRKWEDGDTRSHALISDKLSSEFEVLRRGTTHYY